MARYAGKTSMQTKVESPKNRNANPRRLALVCFAVVAVSWALYIVVASPRWQIRNAKAQATGRLICLACDLPRIKELKADTDCEANGHSFALLTEEGRIVHLLKSDAVDRLIAFNRAPAGVCIVQGKSFSDGSAIVVSSFRVGDRSAAHENGSPDMTTREVKLQGRIGCAG